VTTRAIITGVSFDVFLQRYRAGFFEHRDLFVLSSKVSIPT
jgi:hypothetical protein